MFACVPPCPDCPRSRTSAPSGVALTRWSNLTPDGRENAPIALLSSLRGDGALVLRAGRHDCRGQCRDRRPGWPLPSSPECSQCRGTPARCRIFLGALGCLSANMADSASSLACEWARRRLFRPTAGTAHRVRICQPIERGPRPFFR